MDNRVDFRILSNIDLRNVTGTNNIPMIECGFISYESLAALGKSATIYKFKQPCGLVLEESEVLSNPH